jgi:hypothetical protein
MPQWILNEDYYSDSGVNAVEIAFVLNQILGRRGNESLHEYLRSGGCPRVQKVTGNRQKACAVSLFVFYYAAK